MLRPARESGGFGGPLFSRLCGGRLHQSIQRADYIKKLFLAPPLIDKLEKEARLTLSGERRLFPLSNGIINILPKSVELKPGSAVAGTDDCDRLIVASLWKGPLGPRGDLVLVP